MITEKHSVRSYTSANLFEEAKKYIPGGVHSPAQAFKSVGGNPIVIEKAKGSILTTVEGRELVDYVCAFGPHIFGHNHPVIRQAIDEALDKGTSFATANPYGIELSKKVIEIMPSMHKVRMVNSGTEATMSAIRLARGYTGRDKIIKFAGCYHGHFDALLVKAGSGALTHGNPDSAGVPKSYANETIVLPYNNVEAVEEAFVANRDQIAAVILEPYPGNCGLLFPKKGYLQKLRELCTKNKTVLIFDEVMTGFRVALGGVQAIERIDPDMTTLGKIIGGGLPVGAFGGKSEIMKCLSPDGPVYQAGTLSGNPVVMAAGLAALKLLQEQDPYSMLDQLAKTLIKELQGAAKKKGIAIQTPQANSMFALFFSEKPVTNFDEVMECDAESFRKVFRFALERGVYIPPSPYESCFISTAHAGKPMEKTIEVLTKAIAVL